MSSADDKAMLLAVRGLVYGLPEPERLAVEKAADELRAWVAEEGTVGLMALTLVCVEAGAAG